MITINDMADLVYVTIKDLVDSDAEVSVSAIEIDKIRVTVNGKIYNFILKELMEQKHSAKGFINLIQRKIL